MSQAIKPKSVQQSNGLLTTLKEFPGNVWNSIFRHPLPSSDLGRSQTSFTNFFLHIHPVKVNRHTLKPWYTMGLGLMSFFLFVVLTVSGILLMFSESGSGKGNALLITSRMKNTGKRFYEICTDCKTGCLYSLEARYPCKARRWQRRSEASSTRR